MEGREDIWLLSPTDAGDAVCSIRDKLKISPNTTSTLALERHIVDKAGYIESEVSWFPVWVFLVVLKSVIVP